MLKVKHFFALAAFLVTWKAYEGQKVEAVLRFVGDKSEIGNCVCKQVDKSRQFGDSEEVQALQLVKELESDPLNQEVSIWKMEKRK